MKSNKRMLNPLTITSQLQLRSHRNQKPQLQYANHHFRIHHQIPTVIVINKLSGSLYQISFYNSIGTILTWLGRIICPYKWSRYHYHEATHDSKIASVISTRILPFRTYFLFYEYIYRSQMVLTWIFSPFFCITFVSIGKPPRYFFFLHCPIFETKNV